MNKVNIVFVLSRLPICALECKTLLRNGLMKMSFVSGYTLIHAYVPREIGGSQVGGYRMPQVGNRQLSRLLLANQSSLLISTRVFV